MQYGNYIVHSDEACAVVVRELYKNAQLALLHHQRLDVIDNVEFVFDVPFAEQDPETGQIVTGFKSGWKVDIHDG